MCIKKEIVWCWLFIACFEVELSKPTNLTFTFSYQKAPSVFMWLWDYCVSSRKWQTGWLFSRISVDTKVLALFFSSLWHLLVQLWFNPLDQRVLVSTEVFFALVFCIPTYHPAIKWLSSVMCLWCLFRRNHITDHPTLCRLERRAVVRATNKAIICIQNTAHVYTCRQSEYDTLGTHTDFHVFIIVGDCAEILFSWTVTLT